MKEKPNMDKGLSDAELLALPAANVSPGVIVRVWELHARHVEEQAQEATERVLQRPAGRAEDRA
jgi:hypothetical protein